MSSSSAVPAGSQPRRARPDARRPLLFKIKGNSLEDGPGIRSVVFFKGCPLSCIWCHNPEGWRREAELWWEPERCMQDRSCMAVCSAGAIAPANPGFVDRARCTECFECVDACPTQALSRIGAEWGVDQIVRDVCRYRPFYERSGGGVTLSGGEPMLHMEFASELLARLREYGISTLVQTSGLFALDSFRSLVLPNVDRIHFDIKLVDPVLHRRFCGTDNGRILDNFAWLVKETLESDFELYPSTPLIPGITDTEANVLALAELYARLDVPAAILHLNNPAWLPKCTNLGLTASDVLDRRVGKLYDVATASAIEQVFLDHGVAVSFQ